MEVGSSTLYTYCLWNTRLCLCSYSDVVPRVTSHVYLNAAGMLEVHPRYLVVLKKIWRLGDVFIPYADILEVF